MSIFDQRSYRHFRGLICQKSTHWLLPSNIQTKLLQARFHLGRTSVCLVQVVEANWQSGISRMELLGYAILSVKDILKYPKALPYITLADYSISRWLYLVNSSQSCVKYPCPWLRGRFYSSPFSRIRHPRSCSKT